MEEKKKRAPYKSKATKKKILDLYSQGYSYKEIYDFFDGKLTDWQIYNTINVRVPQSQKPRKLKDGSQHILVEDNDISTDEMLPLADLSEYPSMEKYLEHELVIISNQLQEKKLPVNSRLEILGKLAKITKLIKEQQLESHLTSLKGRLIINIMRRLKPSITETEIKLIFKEESAKLKEEKKRS
jgi:hypothetical protein